MLPQDHLKALAAGVRACFLSVTSLSLSYRTAACPVRQSHSLLPFRIRLPLMYIRLLYIYPLYNYLRHIYPLHTYLRHIYPPHIHLRHIHLRHIYPLYTYPPHIYLPHIYLPHIYLLHIYPLHTYSPHIYLPHIYPPHHIPKHFPLMNHHRKDTPPVCLLPLNIPLMSFYPRRKPAPLRALPPGLYPAWSVLAAQASGLRQAPVQPVLSLHVPSQSPFSIQAYS